MSDPHDEKPSPRLPQSGLADEILSSLDDEPSERSAAASSAADRIYTFTDSLQLGDDEQQQREVYETWVEFDLADQPYGLPVSEVQEILRPVELTPVPNAPHPVLGVFNLRGRVVPLVDLRARLGLAAGEPDQRSRIVVLESRSRSIGLLVDGVERVFKLAVSAIEPAGEGAASAVRGSYPSPSGSLLLLDPAAILALPVERGDTGVDPVDDRPVGRS